MANYGYLSWQFVNSMNCSVWEGDGKFVIGFWLWNPSMHRMSSLSLAMHGIGVALDVQLRK